MAFEANCAIKLTVPDETRIARYVDLGKFVSVLSKRSLFFASVETLRKFDRREAAVPESLLDGTADHFWDGNTPEDVRLNIKAATHFLHNRTRPLVCINCWHINEHESPAMWKMYSGDGQPVAIRSTLGRLKASFGVTRSMVLMGEVEYVNTGKEKRPLRNLLHAFFLKRPAYSHEKELRAIVLMEEGEFGAGTDVDVDLSTLIESVCVSPRAETWFGDAVRAVVERFGFSFAVVHSDLDQEPNELKGRVPGATLYDTNNINPEE